MGQTQSTPQPGKNIELSVVVFVPVRIDAYTGNQFDAKTTM